VIRRPLWLSSPELLAWCPQDYLEPRSQDTLVGQAHPNSVGHASACHPPGGTIAYGDVCDAKKLLIMVAVLHEDLLLTTTNSELPKSNYHYPKEQNRFPRHCEKST